jgi:hypothetical protein
MFKVGDIVILSPGGIAYLKKVAPSILNEWSNVTCVVRENTYVPQGTGIYRDESSWLDNNPDHFELLVEYEEV